MARRGLKTLPKRFRMLRSGSKALRRNILEAWMLHYIELQCVRLLVSPESFRDGMGLGSWWLQGILEASQRRSKLWGTHVSFKCRSWLWPLRLSRFWWFVLIRQPKMPLWRLPGRPQNRCRELEMETGCLKAALRCFQNAATLVAKALQMWFMKKVSHRIAICDLWKQSYFRTN